MKKAFKMFCGLFMFMALVVPFSGARAASVEVSDETELRNAVLEGGDIILTNDIKISSPIDLLKDTTITSKEGNTFTINGEGMTRNPDGNGSILAAHANLTLTNVKIANANKYGVQAYNTGSVVLDGVEISGSGFGAVLINGGTVTIKDLTMTDNLYGIEFAAGLNVTGTPALIMDGVIKGNQKDVLYVDVDQITADKTILVKNTENSTQKISLKDNTIVLMEGDKVLATSNELATGTTVDVDGEKLQAEEPAKEPTTLEEPKDENNDVKDEVENPKTSDGIILAVGTLTLSAGAIVIAKKKLA